MISDYNLLQRDYRFWGRVLRKVRKLPNGCWEWGAYKNRHGYGTIHFAGKGELAHRACYSQYYRIGLVDLVGMEIHHICRNKGCVNPNHLKTITKDQHSRELDSAQSIMRAKTHCPQGHSYSGYNLVITRKDGCAGRVCRKCNLDFVRKYQAKMRKQ